MSHSLCGFAFQNLLVLSFFGINDCVKKTEREKFSHLPLARLLKLANGEFKYEKNTRLIRQKWKFSERTRHGGVK